MSGPDPLRTAASLIARLAGIAQITIVKGIRCRYHVAGQDVTMPTDHYPEDGELTRAGGPKP